ncbi:PfkB family carbohydrate kinase [Oharaeibacter diazotrophicus]|uniref:Ribokinase n=2 Tax=Oharaeibacter diazotrophicus TaxID=1920512 RepID=A0A4R6RLE9_9HYPH|nr:PfkB family carbohydrate kinase [Oharaeibacter diazotrophicus]TDP87473.1 ribokinase [Oharaeibacter diazotrophicus]BBE70583.1 ribokinase [Pleomorphomonas sp. SM30]GLS77329.1 ribokinase [Oharaeibacter diazotrophicus]
MPGKVVVVGSLHYDIMVAAPDRPRRGETVIGEAWWPKCGGKGGNQAVEAVLAGADVAMVGAVGDDAFGAVLRGNLAAAGVDVAAVAVVPGAGSGISVAIQDAGGDYGAVVVSGVNRSIALPDAAVASWRPGDVLVLQNEVPAAVNRAAAAAAAARGLVVVWNAAPALAPDPELLGHVGVVVVNAVEAEMLGGGAVEDLAAALAAAGRLAGGRIAVVTAGGAGVAVAGPGVAETIAAAAVTVRSTHGAGDCFVGVLAARLAAGDDIATAVRAGNAAAGRLVALTEAERAARIGARERG